ncbi:MAG: polyprenyl synthetase family protein [Chloroflexia bacterium]
MGLAEEMARLEQYLRGLVTSPLVLLSRPAVYLLTAGGKRLRALLTLLASRVGNHAVPEAALSGAAAVELIHAASLVHDDLIDQSPHRRGRPTIHEKWHHDVALLTGDYFFSLAARALARTGDIRLLDDIGEAAVAICEGEMSSVQQAEPLEEALEQYTFKVARKTAVLFEAAGKVGARCGGADEETISALGRFGFALGMSFQIVDDVLDYTGDERELGKPAGGDLRRGLITLPLIYAVAYDDADGFLHRLVERLGDALPPEEVEEALERVRASSGPERARREAKRYHREALFHLQGIADPVRSHLEEIACLAVERSR